MNTQNTLVMLLLFVATSALFAQKKDPVLFTVNGLPVNVSEFKYIYEKSNGDEADYSRESLQKYLELYKNFKLKIARARELNLDTIPSLKKELDGYRKKLANSYLIDKEVTDHLAKEVYERMKSDVRISHIFFSLKKINSPSDTLTILNKAKDIKKQLDAGASFEEMAKKASDDTSSKGGGGDIGYLTAMFPNGYYQLEAAAYDTPVGKVSGIIRTVSGYHIVKVTDKRPARGEVEIAQILFAKEKGKEAAAKQKAESALKAIREANLPFKDAAKKFSDDKTTGLKGGYVGFVGINRFEQSFENAIFALDADDQVSDVIESSVGYHIVKRLRKKQVGDFDKEKRVILAKLKRDLRYGLAIEAFVKETKDEAKFNERTGALDEWIRSLPDSTFLTHKWKPTTQKNNKTLFSLKGMTVTIADMDDYAYKATRKRLRYGRNFKIADAAKAIYKDFINYKVMSYAESQLEVKYPEFKALMREYEEGILLFDISRKEVWDKASEDSIGLAAFYPSVQDQFTWGERATVVTYTLPKLYKKMLKKMRKRATKKTPAALLSKYNKSKRVLSMERETYEKSKAPDSVQKVWRKGGITDTVFDEKRQPQTASFMVIEKILPKGPKKLDEARGYAIAKYQDYLEKEWVKTLQKQYVVDINSKVLEALVRK